MYFFVGIHQPTDASRVGRFCMISINRLRGRVSSFEVEEWMLDSGAFTEISDHGRYRTPPEQYAREVGRWSNVGALLAAVSQDYMCEPEALNKTGLGIADHQRLTIERYDAIAAEVDRIGAATYIMPTLQGFA